MGTPDPGLSAAGSQDCNTNDGGGAGVDAVVDTGSRSNCFSDVRAFNLYEWVADWVPLSTICVTALFGTFDSNCLAGASTTFGPGALIRGGNFVFGGGSVGLAGVFAVDGGNRPSNANAVFGFRAGR